MSSEIFESHEDEFKSLYDEINKKINVTLPGSKGEERKKVSREIERSFENGFSLIQEMEEELRNAPSHYRMQMTSRLRNYRKDIEKSQRDFKSRQSALGARSELMTGSMYNRDSDITTMEVSQRARILQGQESLKRSSASIERSHRVATETDAVGVDIIEELDEQKETLLRTKDRVQDMEDHLTLTRKILRAISWGTVTNKVILAVIILVEVVILGAVIYVRFVKPNLK